MFAKRLALLLVLSLGGCTQVGRLLPGAPEDAIPVGRIAVMPIDRDAHATAGDVPPGAERVATAQIYGVLSASPRWRFVPDLAVSDAMSGIDAADDAVARARALGEAVEADSVLFGTLSRYVERIGADYGAQRPAAVSLQLRLLSVATGQVVWERRFDRQQESLAANLFNWWQFWRAGPRWFTAQEFTRLGVERLLEDLERRS